MNSSLIGAADQAVLSAFSLLLGLAFIKLAPKTEYAAFALLVTVLLLTQSLQNALVSSPLTTLLPGKQGKLEQDRVMAAAVRIQSWLVAAVIGTCVLVGVVDAAIGQDRLVLIASVLLGCLGVLSREFVRARYFLQQDALRALASDTFYVLLASGAVAVLLLIDRLSAAMALAAMGAAGVAVGAVSGIRLRWPFCRSTPDDRQSLREIWGCARWALPSVVNSWLYANAFLFIVEAVMSKEAVADLSASRLLLVPFSLLVVGWSNAFRPRASHWFANGQADRVHVTALRSAAGMVGMAAVYACALYLAMPLLQAWVLGEKYSGLGWLVAGWLVFFAVGAARNVGMSSMLASALAFRPLFRYGVLALAVAVPSTVLACLGQSEPGVLIAMTAAELILAAAIWLRGWPAIRRSAPRAG